jgi:V8-like Glu-specific endopeptidase
MRQAAVALTLLIVSCSESQLSRGKVIIGKNDLYELDVADPRRAAIGKFGPACSGFHVGNGKVLTAGHCLSAQSCAPQMIFNWTDFSSGQPQVVVSQCAEILSSEQTSEIDFAVVRVDPVPAELIPVQLVDADLIAGLPVEAISFPKDRPMSSSGPCLVTGKDIGARIFHDCDTSAGSSGAPIIDQQGYAIAIHNRGSTVLQKNGATVISSIPIMLSID